MNAGVTNASEMFQQIERYASHPLADFDSLCVDARNTASQIKIGCSLFMQHYDVASELEYKKQCIQDGRIMYHAHIGMNDMDATSSALRGIYRQLDNRGYRMDRAGFALDRRMGLPRKKWTETAAETGPMLESQQDWSALAQSAPIQPHLGDFMIGQPASFGNTVQALREGCTTIGNLSQFFTFEAPGWHDHAGTSAETIKAIALLAEFREQGTMLHSYLEDGYGALFKECATVAAWAMLEVYIVEDLLGTKLAHCIGGLTSDPVKRSGWVLAFQKIHRGDLVGSMIYGDTISFTQDFDHNRAVVAEYMLWDIATQLYAPSGHAVLPLPVTEAIRIPSAEEIIETQLYGRELEQAARRLLPHLDFSAAQAFADRVYRDGRIIFDNALAGLKQSGVDLCNPLQLLYVLKEMGPQVFEELFLGNMKTQDPTDMYLMSQQVIEQYRPVFESAELKAKVKGRRLLLASTDVHEHAIGALSQLLSEAGAIVTNLGAEQAPDQIGKRLREDTVDAVLLSTHNGMALEYAQQLKLELDSSQFELPILMGGVLNQKVDGEALPLPVVEELKQLGINPATTLPNITRFLLN